MNRNVVPDDQTVGRVRELVAASGVTRAAKRLDLSPQTVVRLLSGLDVDVETLRIARELEGQARGE